MRVPGWIRALPERYGAGYVGGAAALLFLALLCFLLLAQTTQDRLLWTGRQTVGYESDGTVFFTYQGQRYPIDVPGYGNAARVPVVFDPSDPSVAERDQFIHRVTDGTMVLLPVVLAGGLLVLGAARRRRIQRAQDARAGGHGTGLDGEIVQRILAERRRSPR